MFGIVGQVRCTHLGLRLVGQLRENLDQIIHRSATHGKCRSRSIAYTMRQLCSDSFDTKYDITAIAQITPNATSDNVLLKSNRNHIYAVV